MIYCEFTFLIDQYAQLKCNYGKEIPEWKNKPFMFWQNITEVKIMAQDYNNACVMIELIVDQMIEKNPKYVSETEAGNFKLEYLLKPNLDLKR